MMFEVNYGESLRGYHTLNMSEIKKNLNHESWNIDYLSFFEPEAICTEYGYKAADLM